MTDMDNQLSNLDATFSWKCLATEKRCIDAMELGCGSATRGILVDKGSTPDLEFYTIVPFLVPSTFEPLFKCVKDWEEPGS